MAVLPYLGTLGFGFVYDDKTQVLGLRAIRFWSSVPAYFFKPVPGEIQRYYRPIFFLWFRLNYFLFSTHAWGWHLANVLLHGAASLLVFLFLRRYFRDVRSAVAGALVFAIHPVHIETVAWVSGCTDSLMAIGLLGSFLLWLKDRHAPSLARKIGSQFCFVLTLLCKETAIILPLLIGLHALVENPVVGEVPRPIGRRLWEATQMAAPYAGVTAVYIAIRELVLRGVPGTPIWISPTRSLLTIPSILLFYLKHLVWPVRLSLFYDFPVVGRLGSNMFWLPLLLLALISLGAWLWSRKSKDPRIVIAALWMLIPLAPVSYIWIFQPDDFVHDRYLYLSVLGLSILVGLFFEFSWKTEPAQRAPFIPAALLGFVVLSLVIVTAVQAQPWKDNLSLYTHAIHVAPNNILARNNLASEYIAEGRDEEAASILKVLLQDHPGMWLANYNYGYLNYKVGNLAIAEAYLRRAIEIDAKDSYQYLFLGTTYLKEGRLSEAAEQLRQAIARQPDGGGYHFTLGMIELQQGNVAAARAEMQEELKYHPENASRVAQAEAMIDQPAKSPR
ncbi:MAG TPA: tetratricopeptide repeat protein [Candidatus Acidoferrum sp.]|nr:tetratricopeptide repeat protein [Candidatus Acidoferrum sp.]